MRALRQGHAATARRLLRLLLLWLGKVPADPGGLKLLHLIIRAGTLDDTSEVKSAAHIYIGSKQDWVILGDNVPQFEDIYQREQLWPKASLERIQKLA